MISFSLLLLLPLTSLAFVLCVCVCVYVFAHTKAASIFGRGVRYSFLFIYYYFFSVTLLPNCLSAVRYYTRFSLLVFCQCLGTFHACIFFLYLSLCLFQSSCLSFALSHVRSFVRSPVDPASNVFTCWCVCVL